MRHFYPFLRGQCTPFYWDILPHFIGTFLPPFYWDIFAPFYCDILPLFLMGHFTPFYWDILPLFIGTFLPLFRYCHCTTPRNGPRNGGQVDDLMIVSDPSEPANPMGKRRRRSLKRRQEELLTMIKK